MKKSLLIESQYFPPISTIYLMCRYKEIVIDTGQFFEKKSYRNRCYICDSNGLFRLSIPLESGKSSMMPMKDVLISNDDNWQKEHWRSIVSAYNRSPFFEFYKDELQDIFTREYSQLITLNTDVLNFLLANLQLTVHVNYSDTYVNEVKKNQFDARSKIFPDKGKSVLDFQIPVYPQVFSDRLPFQENVSSMDLLFNLGPTAAQYLQTIIVK